MLPALALAVAFTAVSAPGIALGFGFNDVAQRAAQLAATSYKTPSEKLPAALQALTYDQYRDIRFKPQRAWWRAAKLPFELMFFHEGLYYNEALRIHEILPDGTREIHFDPSMFDYGGNHIDHRALRGLGFAGFRVHYAINSPRYKDEVMVFLGASYFRALGKDQRYGISGRGLAIDTGLMSGEEFPRFTEFWIERPAPSARELRIYGLLDSPRAAGAFRFLLKPGAETVVDVRARLFLRQNVAKLGLAPLTSMYYFGENDRRGIDDYRPEVHDSDGLSIEAGTGEWIWRPLIDPKRLLVTSFSVTNPLGFGLMQRDRAFGSYEDLEARYDLRPSVWVEPKGRWGAGRIELVQIPTPDETNDNIVAFFTPDNPPPPGEPLDLEYRMLWQKDSETRPPLAWVAQTRRGHGYLRKPDDSIALMVDFEGPALRKLSAGAAVKAVVTTDPNVDVIESNTFHNDATGGWRLALRIKRRDDKKPGELRAFLRSGNATLSETWSYILPGS
ncbi:MAG TPA: glucan biosynthesis protein G [Casimicrobiaceae bacterium]|nr:glucan biosynthesis protein G [Casimicrobiaceae bacterium]